MATMTLDAVKYDVSIGSRILNLTGLAAGVRASMGHVSLRDPSDPNRFVVKGRGYQIDVLSRMRPEHMVVCDLNGYLIDGPPGVLQCNEVMIHASVFKARPEVKSVVHAHPPYCVMLTVLGIPIVPVVLEGLRLGAQAAAGLSAYRADHLGAQGAEMARCLGAARAVHLFGHGVTTVGNDDGGSRHRDGPTRAPGADELPRLRHRRSRPPRIPDHLIEEYLQWKPLAEPHFQEAVAARPRQYGRQHLERSHRPGRPRPGRGLRRRKADGALSGRQRIAVQRLQLKLDLDARPDVDQRRARLMRGRLAVIAARYSA